MIDYNYLPIPIVYMSELAKIKKEIKSHADKEKAAFFPRFFKTGKGEYAEGDQFIGVTVPNIRNAVKKYYLTLDINETEELLNDRIHEFRLAALLILVLKYQKAGTEKEGKKVVDIFLKNLASVNNWDLVDSSADKILGAYIFTKGEYHKSILYDFARSSDLWKQRIAIMSTFYFIRKGEYEDTLKIAKLLLNHKHDLIHKAVGWMLREVGNRDFDTEFDFLKESYKVMPRTMLRYAIEKFDPKVRTQFLKGQI
jgi:3-methyladenine DNA glycosylase AlkD